MKMIEKSNTVNRGILRGHVDELLDALRYCCVGLELALLSRAYDVMSKLFQDCANAIIPLLRCAHRPHWLAEPLVKVLVAISCLPNEFWDWRLRKGVSCVLTQGVMVAFYQREPTAAKRILLMASNMPLRKWVWIPKIEMIPEERPEDLKKKPGNKAAAANRGKQGDSKNAEEPQEVKLVPKLRRNMFEHQTLEPRLEEWILNLSDSLIVFADYLTEQYQLELENMKKFIGDTDGIDNNKLDILELLDFYIMFSDVSTMNTKLAAKYKDKPDYAVAVCRAALHVCGVGAGQNLKCSFAAYGHETP